MKAVIAEDEPLARAQLKALLEERGVEVVAEAANGLAALEGIEQHRPDVAFLDIEMPSLNGMEVAANLASLPLIVFVTAYNQYAIQAFEANAADYLLKPLDPERLDRTLTRLRERLQTGTAPAMDAILSLLRRQKTATLTRLAARKAKRIVLVPVKEIQYITTEDKLVFLVTAQGRLLMERTIAELDETLEPEGFFRISRSEIVNMACVVELMPWFSGTWRVKLSNGVELDVSRERSRELKELLGV